MAQVQIVENVSFTLVNCGECGGSYCINERFHEQKRNNGGGWTCPYCKCGWGFFGKTEAQKLRAQLEQAEKDKEWHKRRAADERAAREKTERRLVATRGANTRIRNRIKHGVCPCCTRSFANLASHMKTKHPDFAPTDEPKTE